MNPHWRRLLGLLLGTVMAATFVALAPPAPIAVASTVEEVISARGQSIAGGDGATSPLQVFTPANAAGGAMLERFGGNLAALGFAVPRRLKPFAERSVSVANDWHFPMMRDVQRNEAFKRWIGNAIAATAGATVLEIGTGSGLLAMIAAQASAAHVYSVEANPDFAALATRIIDRNGLGADITVIAAMSTDVTIGTTIEAGAQQAASAHDVTAAASDVTAAVLPRRANVLVAETIGTLLLSESQLDYVADARERLCTPNTKIVPGGGKQYVTIFASPLFDTRTRASRWNGFDFSIFNELRDTATLKFTRTFGLRLRDIEMTELTAPLEVQRVNFYTDSYHTLPNRRVFQVQALADGEAHGVFAHFELCEDGDCALTETVISTHPSRTTFARDMAWGQGLQLLGSEQNDGMPLVVRRGDRLNVTVAFTRTTFQVAVAPANGHR